MRNVMLDTLLHKVFMVSLLAGLVTGAIFIAKVSAVTIAVLFVCIAGGYGIGFGIGCLIRRARAKSYLDKQMAFIDSNLRK